MILFVRRQYFLLPRAVSKSQMGFSKVRAHIMKTARSSAINAERTTKSKERNKEINMENDNLPLKKKKEKKINNYMVTLRTLE